MATILSSIQKWLLIRRISSHQAKVKFYSEYLPVYTLKEEKKLSAKTNMIELKQKKALLSFDIRAKIESEFVKEDKGYLEAIIKNKYILKQKALKQISKRLEKKTNNIDHSYEGKKKSIDNELSRKLIELNSRYYQTNKPLNHANHQKVVLSTNQKYNSFIQKKKLIYERRITNKNNRLTSLINYHQKVVDKFQPILKLLTLETNAYENQMDELTILKLDGLSMHFGGLKAVENLSFEVKKGSIFGLIGPNGAGKTTVFNCITRFYKATSGNVYYRNHNDEVILLNDYLVHNVIKEGIVRTFQNVELIWELNVIDNLLVAAHTLYRSSFFGHLFNSRVLRQEEMILKQKAIKILIDLGLESYMYMYPLGLPYGILKKVELARTLMANPRLIILDEPAAGLNDAETENLAHTIKKIRDEYHTTIFLVEHDMGLVMDICDTICAISFGKKLAIGTPKEIQNSQAVREAYLGGE